MRPTRPGPGHLAENVMHFARLLRAAGLPVGGDRVQLALRALQVAGLERRGDFHAALSACLLDRIEHRALFDQAFELYWLHLDLPRQLPARAAPRSDAAPPPPTGHRLGAALFAREPEPPVTDSARRMALDAALSVDDREHLYQADFESMSVDEWRAAQRLLSQLRLAVEPIRSRRSRRAPRAGRADWRASLQAMARHGGEMWDMRWREPRTRPAPLVLLADISGSMSRYSRMLLHFGHLLGQADGRVESFVFGTRLTRITRLLHSRDPDLAVSQVVRAVADWSGGTRITTSLHEFNQRWARRVLPGQATVLLVTDGLEHGDTRALSFEMERLHKSCRRLIWLNPLLRFDGFEPRAGGIKAMLPFVDRFLPVHNLASLEQLVNLLGQPGRKLPSLRPPRPGGVAQPATGS